ncbi:hypothetical protein BDQ17DRAFT_1313121 [Cyathus striatus]|nr:hypothetical protein BDQ17DRAFT_1313121 [Cyathus striatus]
MIIDRQQSGKVANTTMSSIPGIDILIGPMLIGVFLNTILYGVFVVQAFIYYQTYRQDASWIRYFILYLFIMETINTGFDIGMMYEPLILRNGTSHATSIIPMMLSAEPIVTVLIATPVQYFIAWRVKVISKSIFLSLIIGVFATCALAGGLWTSISITLIPQFARLQESDAAVITWLTSSAVADILITLSLSYSLIKRKTGIKTTDDKLSKIIRLTVHTGALTTLVAILDVAVFVAAPIPTVIFIWDFCLSKLYSNALLSTLNARAGWENLNGTKQAHNVLFGENPSASLTAVGGRGNMKGGSQFSSVKHEKPAGIYELSKYKSEPGWSSVSPAGTLNITHAEPINQDDEMEIHVSRTVETLHDGNERMGSESV